MFIYSATNYSIVTTAMYVYAALIYTMSIRAETNTRFARIFTRLHKYLNIKRVFEYTLI